MRLPTAAKLFNKRATNARSPRSTPRGSPDRLIPKGKVHVPAHFAAAGLSNNDQLDALSN
jgi:hypothetical protein